MLLCLKAQSDGVGLVEALLARILELERRVHVLRSVERLQSFPVEDVLVGDLRASWRCCLCGLSLRQHHGRVARRRLLELLLRRRQLLSGDASSHVNILLYFLNSHRLLKPFLYVHISLFPGLLVLYLL